MKKYLVALFILAGCGGGSSAGESSLFFGGVYSGIAEVTQNTCNFSVDQFVTFNWTVNQDDKRILLETSEGAVLEGAPVDSASFAVSKENTSGNCRTITSILMTGIESDRANAFFGIDTNCGLGVCSVVYSGSAVRK